MKNLLLLSLLSLAASCYAGSDTTFYRHEFSINMTNGLSAEFFDNAGHGTTNKVVLNFPGGTRGSVSELPMYAMHLQIRYSLGISAMVRLETGIGYLLAGGLQRGYVPPIYFNSGSSHFDKFYYKGCITLPLYVKVIKAMHRGAFTCTIGPDFALPVNDTYKYQNMQNFRTLDPKDHYRYRTYQTTDAASMGVHLKMAYEKHLTRHLLINVGPVIDFYGAVHFHPGYDSYYNHFNYTPCQFYTGLDVAFSFGLK